MIVDAHRRSGVRGCKNYLTTEMEGINIIVASPSYSELDSNVNTMLSAALHGPSTPNLPDSQFHVAKCSSLSFILHLNIITEVV